jgi:hypothetical protein
VVENTLELHGHPSVWALGDCAALTDAKSGKPFASWGTRLLVLNRRFRLRVRNPYVFPDSLHVEL